MVTTQSNNGIEVKEDGRNKKFQIGDHVKFSHISSLPNGEGIIEKKYNSSALVSFKVGNKITKQIYEELNGRYVINYDNLKIIKKKEK